MSNVKIKNEMTLAVFSLLIGGVTGIVMWAFSLCMNLLTELLWEELPQMMGLGRLYPLIICSIGGVIIGLCRKKFGNYPNNMNEVFATLKEKGAYPYNHMLALIVLSFLPLIFGASVGPEAGMVGIIVALCCWAGDNLKFAKKSVIDYSSAGAAVSLSILFHAPLFGIFEVAEANSDEKIELSKTSTLLIYVLAIVAGLGSHSLLAKYVYEVGEGLPSFATISIQKADYFAMILYIVAGLIMAFVYEKSEHIFEHLSTKIPAVIAETIVGICFGAILCFVPEIQFSGQGAMGNLMNDYLNYVPVALIGIALLKLISTSFCIQLGWKGGHFFPLIFSSVCMGYGISLLIFPGEPSHIAFAAAAVAGSALGAIVKQPIAVAMLLLLCFPFSAVLWILFSAVVAFGVCKIFSKNK